MTTLERAEWPHNLRQLDGTLQRIMIEAAVAGSAELGIDHCPPDVLLAMGAVVEGRRKPSQEAVRERMLELNSICKTAESLGISRWTVSRRLREAK